MKNRLLLLFVIISVLNSTQILAQSNFSTNTQSTDQATSLLAPLTSPIDSLAGFDEIGMRNAAINDGIHGIRLKEFMESTKRYFIDEKFSIGGFAPTNIHLQNPTGRIIGGGALISATLCVNEGFESGSLTNWTVQIGRNNSSQTYPTFTNTIGSGSLVSVVSTPITDPFVGTIPASPLGGSFVARINNKPLLQVFHETQLDFNKLFLSLLRIIFLILLIGL